MQGYWQKRVHAYRMDIEHINNILTKEHEPKEVEKLKQQLRLCKTELEHCLMGVATFETKKAG